MKLDIKKDCKTLLETASEIAKDLRELGQQNTSPATGLVVTHGDNVRVYAIFKAYVNSSWHLSVCLSREELEEIRSELGGQCGVLTIGFGMYSVDF